MLLLYSGSGAKDFYLEGIEHPQERWEKVLSTARKFLEAEGEHLALTYLETLPFRLYRGSNFFNDEFTVLQCSLPFDRYMELADVAIEYDTKHAFSAIASAFSRLGTYVRFVCVEVAQSDRADPVGEPVLETASDAVRRALSDASHLLATKGPLSALDRAHTAFHGYLREICADAHIPVPADAPLTFLFKSLRESHPKFATTGVRPKDIEKIYKTLANIVDALDPLRNRASLAHPNEQLLAEPEAMLALNSVRTLFNYILAKLDTE